MLGQAVVGYLRVCALTLRDRNRGGWSDVIRCPVSEQQSQGSVWGLEKGYVDLGSYRPKTTDLMFIIGRPWFLFLLWVPSEKVLNN